LHFEKAFRSGWGFGCCGWRGIGAAALQHLKEHLFEERGGAVGGGVGERGAFGGVGHAEVVELAFHARQPGANLPQGMGPTKLAEEHRHKLRPAIEPLGGALRFVPLDRR